MGEHERTGNRVSIPAEIIPCNAIPFFTTVKELVDLFKDRTPHQVEYLQHEIDFLFGRDYKNSAKPIVSCKTELTMPLDLHILGVVHSSPVEGVVCVEPFGLDQKNIFRGS